MTPLLVGLSVGLGMGIVGTLVLHADPRADRIKTQRDWYRTLWLEAMTLPKLRLSPLDELDLELLKQPGYSIRDGRMFYSAADLDKPVADWKTEQVARLRLLVTEAEAGV